MQKIEFRAMGSHISALIDSDNEKAIHALEQVPAWFEEWEQALSRFRETSELSAVNAQAGQTTRVSDAFFEVARHALMAAEWSGGIVVPTILPALQHIGYDRSFDQVAASQWGSLNQARPALPDWHLIQLDPAAKSIYMPKGVNLDFGGVAKGWAAEQAAQRLGQIAPALVDAGGDVCVSGPQADGRAWPIGVADPISPEADLMAIGLMKGCAATSGRDYRTWLRGNTRVHHLIDPRTGLPAQSDVLSATIIAPTARQAETAAKTALILGSDAGMEWLDSRFIAGLLVLDDGEIITNDELQMTNSDSPFVILTS
ncbi:MAG TPA: FAD:protein FMN transferase [Thermoflexales bacterium]|nr:FAD:protein FMN transferase [Thermoflexales bacterium]HQW34066.1 FAD:protein FMN transferase [Thermoflexales bacterium]HQX75488.1 FAD:protein FMN transferase [Thermoflexales bacterium]HQZ22463.1 FAD:protein FMN transferase [Thermoflexales bacterium]HQZ99404.1 FAD:protein FMN transferase [Thermoflexales bacterium]